jgi:hypothetical protein
MPGIFVCWDIVRRKSNDVPEEDAASIFRIEKQGKQETKKKQVASKVLIDYKALYPRRQTLHNHVFHFFGKLETKTRNYHSTIFLRATGMALYAMRCMF